MYLILKIKKVNEELNYYCSDVETTCVSILDYNSQSTVYLVKKIMFIMLAQSIYMFVIIYKINFEGCSLRIPVNI